MTRYPGVYRVDDMTYWIRAKIKCPRTGKSQEVEKFLEGVTIQEAVQRRTELVETLKQPAAEALRMQVGGYAKLWIASKALKLDASTMRTYTAALEDHILPVLGDFFYDQLTSLDVQRWIDGKMTSGWCTSARAPKETEGAPTARKPKRKDRRKYAQNSLAGWFRVFRAMTRDAIEALRLERDPTLRVSLGDAEDASTSEPLTPDEWVRFLDAWCTYYPQHYALVATLASTGLRFCHASALRREDWDRSAAVLHVVRKHYRGVVGPVSKKKRAPKLYPIEPWLAAILEDHCERMERKNARGFVPQDVDGVRNEGGWLFPSAAGTLRTANSLDRAWAACLKHAGITKRFTIHGLRYTFEDLTRLAKVDPIVRRSLTGHVTEKMQRRYSTVGLDEQRAAVAKLLERVAPSGARGSGNGAGSEHARAELGGTSGGTETGPTSPGGSTGGSEHGPTERERWN